MKLAPIYDVLPFAFNVLWELSADDWRVCIVGWASYTKNLYVYKL